jgi:hypothetical protein
VPAPIPTSGGDVSGTAIPAADFAQLARIPIQIVYGDNIPDEPSVYNFDLWRGRRAMCKLSVERLRVAGGDAQLLNLPEIGIHGNTHFAMSDLNNEEIADLLSQYLHRKHLDGYPAR